MFPKIKLALVFAKMARDHGSKILHANNPDLLTHDLGEALRQQKNVLSDPRKGLATTAYDVLPIVLEVKILTMVTASNFGIDTKGKADIQVLEEIIAKADERNGGKYAAEIKSTLEWTRRLFENPEIQDVLSMEMTALETPKNLNDVKKFFMQLAGRSTDELARINEFVKRMKQQGGPDAADKTMPSAPKK